MHIGYWRESQREGDHRAGMTLSSFLRIVLESPGWVAFCTTFVMMCCPYWWRDWSEREHQMTSSFNKFLVDSVLTEW
jgi:hypothetical protein